MPAPLRIAPADDNKFFAIEAGLESRAMVTLIPAIDVNRKP
jgi:hypothetical protein